MQQVIISKCGYICSDCPWSRFVRQRTDESDWEEYSKQIKKFVGFKPIKYEWEGCVGCNTPTEEFPKHMHYGYLKNCHVRNCVEFNEIKSCAYCSRFPCANGFIGLTKESMSKRINEDVSNSDYDSYIRMFDCLKHMKELGKAIPKAEIRDPKPVKYKNKHKNPSDQFSDEAQKKFYTTLFNMFTSKLDVKDSDTYAGVEIIKRRLDPLARILWLTGIYGKIEEKAVKVDSITLMKQKKSSKVPHNQESWKIYTNFLSTNGLTSKLALMTDDKIINTPMGYIREKIPKTDDPSYFLEMRIDPTSDLPASFLKDLQTYCKGLDEKSGKRGFSHFKKLKIL